MPTAKDLFLSSRHLQTVSMEEPLAANQAESLSDYRI